MELTYSGLNWLAIFASFVVGQVVLTVWFAALFGEPWAKEYGATTKQEHTKAIPPYTYAIGAFCMLLLVTGLAVLQRALGVSTVGAGVGLGLFVALHVSIATALPGYAFLKRLNAFSLAIGAQVVAVVLVSAILAAWQ